MWKKILEYFAHLLTLAEATQENKAEIKELRRELRDLTSAVQELRHEFCALRTDQQHTLEKVALRLENELLRFERRLPAVKRGKDRSK